MGVRPVCDAGRVQLDRRHFPTADLLAGAHESWELEVIDPDGDGLGLSVGMVLGPLGTWWWTQLCRSGRSLVLVAEDDVPLPGGANLEVRASGLWAEVGIQRAGEHLSADLEAFGVAFDDVADVFGSGRGIRQPVGLDVEWHATAEARPVDGGHVIPARVEGEILVGSEAIELTDRSVGSWIHRYGVGSWPGPQRRAAPHPCDLVAPGAVAVGGWEWTDDLVRAGDGTLSWRTTPRWTPADGPRS